MAGVKKGGSRPAEAPPRDPAADGAPKATARPVAESPAPAPIGQYAPRREQGEAAPPSGGDRLGDEALSPAELARMSSFAIARHLMIVLAKGRGAKDRADLLAYVSGLVLGLDDPGLARRVLLEMTDAGRIVDIYPLEVMAYVMERRRGYLRDIEFGPVILNAEALAVRTFAVAELIPLKVPLALKMRAFALSGGGFPGYAFAPAAPGAYELELGEAGVFTLFVRGDIKKKSYVDRVVLRVEDRPDASGGW